MVARDEHFAQDVGAIADDGIDPRVEQAPHDDGLIHRPRHHPYANLVRHRHKPFNEDRDETELDRHMRKRCGGHGPRWPHPCTRAHQQGSQRSPSQSRRDLGYLLVDPGEQPIPCARNADSFGNAPAPQGFHQRPHPSLVLGVDREALLRKGVQCLVERRNRLNTVDPQGADLAQRLQPDRAFGRRDSLERLIVEAHKVAVAGHPDVRLEIAKAQARSQGEGDKRILLREARATAVGDRQRSGFLAVAHVARVIHSVASCQPNRVSPKNVH